MSKLPWTKFFWTSWSSDTNLRSCSLAARGLWMEMLCIAAVHDPVGYVLVNGKPPSIGTLARLCACSPMEVERLAGELESHGVFSRDRNRHIYCRRMVKDARRSRIGRETGVLGGNPTIRKDKENSPTVKGLLARTPATKKLEAREEVSDVSNDTSSSSASADDVAALERARASIAVPPPPPPPPDPIVAQMAAAFAAWNVLAGRLGLPEAKVLNDKRRRQLRNRLKSSGPESWDAALVAVERSAFLRGTGGGWRCDLDFLLQPSSFQRVVEGSFDRSEPTITGAPSRATDRAAARRDNIILAFQTPAAKAGPGRRS